MRRRAVVALSALFAGAAIVWACGGSSSETPWPVEPLDLEQRPAGEQLRRGNVVDVKKLPTRYGDAGTAGGGGGQEPEEEPLPEEEEPPARPRDR